MADYSRITQLLDELRSRIELLSTEVGRLRGVEAPRRLDRARTVASLDQAAAPTAADVSKVIPPTRTNDPDSIVGGSRTREFPDCCAVGDLSNYYCSGTLIAPNLVVTAEHCGDNLRRVFLKGFDINRPERGEVIPVVQNVAHPTADLRVLKLEWNSTVAHRHIAQGAEVKATNATLVGFGTTDLAGTFGYGVKRRVQVPIASLACAAPDDPAQFGCSPGNEMVAGHRGLARDSCRGDSGGPLYIRRAEGGFDLLGATSRGIANAPNVCGDGGIYVRVDQFIDWITAETGVAIEGPRL